MARSFVQNRYYSSSVPINSGVGTGTGSSSGSSMFGPATGGTGSGGESTDSAGKGTLQTASRTRNVFPETWIWDSVLSG